MDTNSHFMTVRDLVLAFKDKDCIYIFFEEYKLSFYRFDELTVEYLNIIVDSFFVSEGNLYIRVY